MYALPFRFAQSTSSTTSGYLDCDFPSLKFTFTPKAVLTELYTLAPDCLHLVDHELSANRNIDVTNYIIYNQTLLLPTTYKQKSTIKICNSYHKLWSQLIIEMLVAIRAHTGAQLIEKKLLIAKEELDMSHTMWQLEENIQHTFKASNIADDTIKLQQKALNQTQHLIEHLKQLSKKSSRRSVKTTEKRNRPPDDSPSPYTPNPSGDTATTTQTGTTQAATTSANQPPPQKKQKQGAATKVRYSSSTRTTSASSNRGRSNRNQGRGNRYSGSNQQDTRYHNQRYQHNTGSHYAPTNVDQAPTSHQAQPPTSPAAASTQYNTAASPHSTSSWGSIAARSTQWPSRTDTGHTSLPAPPPAPVPAPAPAAVPTQEPPPAPAPAPAPTAITITGNQLRQFLEYQAKNK
jgi:hypothetical protein